MYFHVIGGPLFSSSFLKYSRILYINLLAWLCKFMPFFSIRKQGWNTIQGACYNLQQYSASASVIWLLNSQHLLLISRPFLCWSVTHKEQNSDLATNSSEFLLGLRFSILHQLLCDMIFVIQIHGSVFFREQHKTVLWPLIWVFMSWMQTNTPIHREKNVYTSQHSKCRDYNVLLLWGNPKLLFFSSCAQTVVID
jgi:hypothetical protein